MKTPEEMAIDYCEPILSDDYARAIGREDWIGTRCVFVGQGHEMYKAFLAGYKAAKDETNLPTPAKWISVKDRLPDVLESVLVLYAPTNKAKNDYRMECWNWPETEVYEIQFITHWMPLPAPPKEEK